MRAVIALVAAIALVARVPEFWAPPELAALHLSHDGGVYLTASQAALHGIWPYADYFFAHPPLAAVAYLPALLIDDPAWGGYGALVLARYLALAYSLAATALAVALGWQLAGPVGGAVAGLLWALDHEVARHGAQPGLDTPMVMLSLAALLAYVMATGNSSRRSMLLVLAGALATASGLLKLVGLTSVVIILIDVAVTARTGDGGVRRWWSDTAAVLVGVGIVSAVTLGPILLVGPDAAIRDAVVFHMLRPANADLAEKIEWLTAHIAGLLAVVVGALGVVAAAVWAPAIQTGSGCARQRAAWRISMLWLVANAAAFLISPVFHPQYYVHLAAPLVLAGSGVALAAAWAPLRRVGRHSREVAAGIAMVACVLILPRVTAAVRDPVPPPARNGIVGEVSRLGAVHVLTTAVPVSFLSGHAPDASSRTGYLVDPYGLRVALDLGLLDRDLGVLVGDAVVGDRPDRRTQSAAAAADWQERVSRADVVVLSEHDEQGLPEGSLEAMRKNAVNRAMHDGYAIYTMRQGSGRCAGC